MSKLMVAVVARVSTPGLPVFQLRKGEEGLSVFDPTGVEPTLSEEEILDAFRPGSVVVYRATSEIAALGLEIVPTEGADTLPDRLRLAHREIRAAENMTRSQYKTAIKELETS